MKKFIFTLSFILAPCAVNAGQVLPNLYAEKYCEYRTLGISEEDSRKAAIDESYISTGTSIKVKYNGKMYDRDVLDSFLAVVKKCPEFLK